MPKVSVRRPLVVAPVYDGLCTFEFAVVAEVFGLDRPEMGLEWYRFASCAIEPGPLQAQGGLTIRATGGLKLLDQADLIVIPGWKGPDVAVPTALTRRLIAAWTRGARLASICSGAFVLAATGLLDGRRAATHWRYAEQLAHAHPAITVDARVLYVEEDRLFTSAGSAAGIDLLLHIVRSDFGVDAANSVARRLVMPPHRNGGQAQFIERPVHVRSQSRLTPLLDRIRADLGHAWTVASMASEAAMSSRTFLRRFAEITGTSPTLWLIEARIDEAKRLLESTGLAIEQVATTCGFGSVSTLRHHFRRRLLLSPREYRDRFGIAFQNRQAAFSV